MKSQKLIVTLGAAAILSACASGPVINAEQKKVVHMKDVFIEHKKPEAGKALGNIGSLALMFTPLAVFSHAPAGMVPYDPAMIPERIIIVWNGSEDQTVAHIANIPYTEYLEQHLHAGDWAYYHPRSGKTPERFEPCLTPCGPPGTPGEKARQLKAEYIAKRDQRIAERKRLQAEYKKQLTSGTTPTGQTATPRKKPSGSYLDGGN